MQAKAGFAGGEDGDAADCRDDSREHGKTCVESKNELYHARLTAGLQKTVWAIGFSPLRNRFTKGDKK
jgi:hypothetical protein